MTAVTEFVFFRVKPSVKPEEGEQNREGEQLLDLFRETILQSGHLGSAWGRTLEDENVLVWVIDWADAYCTTSLSRLEPFVDNNKDDPATLTNIFSTLSPAISETDTLTTNPVTELVTLAVPSDLSPEQHRQFNIDQTAFQAAGLTNPSTPEDSRALTWARGQVERPSMFDHPGSGSGKVVVHLHAVGWRGKEHHAAFRETQAFADTIVPLRKVALSPAVKGLEMKHVKFQKIGF
ncbi:hypothetical protein UA08_09004 [Talaromyces atroroseus]|uniref:ABM domain-containing protein n=1 Tax=Talaromyces atroroseus TaxID=1441469 RepID=A0A1Q5Q763_TALAT|nr:hypothetical protein UA08_09004 [Talaromyces atroroseus]OKL55686.1 hypothetical protein UA08_09004 [Talaromyces atroroseus]